MKPKYKWLRVRHVYKGTDYILNDEDEYTSWLEDLPKGWYKAFGEQMADDLNEVLVKYDYVDEYRIHQIKEKFGSLRWYDGGYLPEMRDEYLAVLNRYEVLSENTCISCGEPATHMTTGWTIPLCDECDKK